VPLHLDVKPHARLHEQSQRPTDSILLCYCTEDWDKLSPESAESQISPATCVSCYTLARLTYHKGTCLLPRLLLSTAPGCLPFFVEIESHEVTAYHDLRHHPSLRPSYHITNQRPFPYGFPGFTVATPEGAELETKAGESCSIASVAKC